MGDFYVYCWTNKVNGKRYVGKGRGKRALMHLRKNSKSMVSHAIRKYGQDNFELRYLATDMEEHRALWLEQQMIAALGTACPTGYNLTLGGEGMRPSSELRAQISKRVSGEGNPNFGKKHSAETKALIGASSKGRPRSPESLKKRADAVRGRKHTPEAIEKIRKANQGENNHRFGTKASEETRKKMSESRKGRPKSEEHKRKLREHLERLRQTRKQAKLVD